MVEHKSKMELSKDTTDAEPISIEAQESITLNKRLKTVDTIGKRSEERV